MMRRRAFPSDFRARGKQTHTTHARGEKPRSETMWQSRNRQRLPGFGPGTPSEERRVRTSVLLTRLTLTDGEWLGRVLPSLQHSAHAQAGAVRVEDVVLRHRPGRLGIADAMDATAELLEPFV